MGGSLLLEVRPNGAKYWIVRFWVKGKEKQKHLESYPGMSTKEARTKAVKAKIETFEPFKNTVVLIPGPS